MTPFKDFYQFTAPTRVIAGRDLIGSCGFEFAKEGAHRVLVVTDAVIRATGLIDRVAEGLADGGVELAGVHDEVPPDSDTDVVRATAQAARDSGADAILAVGGGSVMDTANGDVADVLAVPGGTTLADHLRGVVRALGLPGRLSDVGVPEAGIPQLVEGAMGDGCTLVNPVEPTEEDLSELYRLAL